MFKNIINSFIVFIFIVGNSPLVFASYATNIATDASGVVTNGSVSLRKKQTTSSDGRYIIFSSTGTNLVSGDTNGVQDVFWKDLQTGTIKRISVSTSLAQSNGISSPVAISGDGRYALFNSVATNLHASDSTNDVDLYMYDTDTDTLTLITTIGASGTHYEWDPNLTFFPDGGLSNDGRYVLFFSNGAYTESDDNARYNYYRYDTQEDEYALIGETPEGDVPDANDTFALAHISTDGSTVIWQQRPGSTTDSEHPSGQYRYYKYDVATKTTTYIDTSSTGSFNWGDFAFSNDLQYGFIAVYGSYTHSIYRRNLDTEEEDLVFTMSSPVESYNYNTSSLSWTTMSQDGRYVFTDGHYRKPEAGTNWSIRQIDVETGKVVDVSPRGDLYPGFTDYLDTTSTISYIPYTNEDSSCLFFISEDRLNSTDSDVNNLYRTCAPTVSLSAIGRANNITKKRDFTVDIAVSDDVTDLAIDDFVCTNCTVTSLTQRSDRSYTAEVRAANKGSTSVYLPKSSVVATIMQVEDSNTLTLEYTAEDTNASSSGGGNSSSNKTEGNDNTQNKKIDIVDTKNPEEVTENKTSCIFQEGLIQKGSLGEDVRNLQICLNDRLGDTLAVDGIFGDNTKASVLRFQKKHNLEKIDGIVGPITKSKF